MTDGIHPELRTLARWLPRGLARAWLIPLLQRLPVPLGCMMQRRHWGPHGF